MSAKDKLIRAMIETLGDLGNCHWSRIDARRWAWIFLKRAKKLGIYENTDDHPKRRHTKCA